MRLRLARAGDPESPTYPAGASRPSSFEPRQSAEETAAAAYDRHLELRSGEIHLWRADLDRNLDALPALAHTLRPDELASAGQFRLERDRNRYLFAHGVLRAILARYLNAAPHELVFRCGPQGKPELAEGAVRFNLSHSYDLVLCAVSCAGHVGVDVEQVRPGVEQDLVRYLPARGRHRLEALPRSVWRRTLFRGWTRMEAYTKARGARLESALAAFDVFCGPCDPAHLRCLGDAEKRRRWWVHDLSPRRGYVGAVVARRRKCCSLTFWKWEADLNSFEVNHDSLPA
jgi:4'-phosphopantetheinyl transferase